MGGHSYSVDVEGKIVDLGVQAMAPKMYPNLVSMLALADFQHVELQPIPLNIACAFPPDSDGNTPYWGNFQAYQGTDLYTKGKNDCETFQRLLKEKTISLEALMPLPDFLELHKSEFEDLEFFENFFLDPYMSIMNGYGSARLEDTLTIEIAPIWNWGYASLTQAGNEFKRFKDGSVSWINCMYELAKSALGEKRLEVVYNATVEKLYPSANGPTVEYCVNGTSPPPRSFDYVVSTVDMKTNGKILDHPENKLWDSLYSHHVGESVWPLHPGYCYLHQDTNIFAPGMPVPREETQQFTAYFSTEGAGNKPFNLLSSWTTYVEKNLMSIDGTFDYYLTMYGFDPNGPRDPNDPSSPPYDIPVPKMGVVKPTPMDWEHGMWLPFYMWDQKMKFHACQSVSAVEKPGLNQVDTGIFFAGNNLTMDSEEGALVSGLTLAQYAFGVKAIEFLAPQDPFEKENDEEYLFAAAECAAFYELMFHRSHSLIGGATDGMRIMQKLVSAWRRIGLADR